MENLPFAFADIIIAIVVLVSAFLAYMRGLVREVLAVGAWVGAAFSTLYGFSLIRPYIQTVISHELIANIVTSLGIFVITLVAFSIISHAISKSVKGSALSALDRALGCAFGLARGAVLTCLIYLGAAWIWTVDELPEVILQARSLSVIQSGAEMLLALAPQKTKENDTATLGNTEKSDMMKNRLRALTNPQPKSSDGAQGGSQPAYNNYERKDMQRLIESNK